MAVKKRPASAGKRAETASINNIKKEAPTRHGRHASHKAVTSFTLDRAVIEALKAVAAADGRSMANLLQRWLYERPEIKKALKQK